ncbi:MAG: DUF5915 domain-containing protein, partial [Chitinophagaceae bacterium]
ALYANVDDFSFEEEALPVSDRTELDQWILSELNSLVKNVTENLDDYEPTQAGRAIEFFVNEQLSNWYVRLCRRRFWKPSRKNADGNFIESEVKDKLAAYQTLYECLVTVSSLMAPIAPFFADWLYKNLNSVTHNSDIESIHLSDFPKPVESLIDKDLEERMKLAQDISSLILSLRKKVNIKVRQPLQKVIIPTSGKAFEERVRRIEDIIKSETNIKEIDLIPASNDFIKKKAKANFKTLGKKLGAKMKWAAQQIQSFTDKEISEIEKGDFLLNPAYQKNGEEPVYINNDDLEISTNEIEGFEIAVKGNLTVALDLVLSPKLVEEGFAREFINRIQNIRKESNFELTDRILIEVQEKSDVKNIITNFKEYICAEILADEIVFLPEISNGTNIDVNDETITVKVTQKGN